MPTARLLCCSFLLLLTTVVTGQPTNEGVLARAELASSTITIGDQIYLEVNVSAPAGTQVQGVAAGAMEAVTGIEIIERGTLNTVAEQPELLLQQRFLITSFDTGRIFIPELPYLFERPGGQLDTALTNDLLLTVNAIPVTEENDIMPIKPIIEEPRNFWDFWPLYAVLLVGGLAYAGWQYRKRLQKPPPPPPPPPPADYRALTELDALEERQLWQAGNTKEYYSELTRILREYLEGQFGTPAMEMTTRQIKADLEKRTELPSERRTEVGELLQLSDLVKFAKATPAAELHPRGLARVREFVRRTSALRTAPEVGAGGAVVISEPTAAEPEKTND